MFSPRCSLRCWGPLLAVSFLLPLGTSYAQDSAADASCDLDGDGVLALACDPEGDCNDEDASVYPGAVEVPEDGVDQDCDGLDLVYVITPADDALLAGGAGTCGLATGAGAWSALLPLAFVLGRRRTCASA